MKVGFREGRSEDKNRPNWEDNGPRPLSWVAWYPTFDDAVERHLPLDAPSESWFAFDPVARNAPILGTKHPFPTVLLSHGMGGAAMGLAWLGRRLASQGFVSIAVNHHGNTYVEPYHAEGFLCLWERARDLTVLLDEMSLGAHFGDRIDKDRVYVAGFSAGAFTALLLLGAVAEFSQFEPMSPIPGASRGPKEFPDLAGRLPDLLKNSAVFRASWARMSSEYRDMRFKAALVCAPGRSVLGFSDISLVEIDTPLRIVVGEADRVAPPQECATWLQERISTSALEILSPSAGHYVFLPEATEVGRLAAPEVCRDAPGVDRRAIHAHVAKLAAVLFRAT